MNKLLILIMIMVCGLLLATGSMSVLSSAAIPGSMERITQIEGPVSLEAAGIPYDWKYADYTLGAYKSAGDVNGDGYDDVIVGIPQYNYDPNQGTYERGKVLVFHGSSAGISSTPNWTEIFTGTQSAHFGSSVNTAGDVNNDGYDDVIIGAEYYSSTFSNEGAAYVYYGSSDGLSANPAWSYVGGGANFYFGHSVSTAGDVNYDDFDDILVGAPGYHSSDNYRNGMVYLFLGSSSGPSLSPDWSKSDNYTSAQFGDVVAAAGHVNDDDYADILVGTFWRYSGRVQCFAGTASGLTADAVWTVDGEWPPGGSGMFTHFGRWIGAGNFNGDAYDDVIVGASEYYYTTGTSGKVYVYHGSAAGLSYSPNWTAMGTSPAGLGWYVSSAGDFNNDGYDDAILGAPYTSNGGTVYLYYGSSSGLTNPAWWVDGDWAYSGLGGGASAGDINNDGYSDILFDSDMSATDYKPTVYSIYGEADVAIGGLMATNNSPTEVGNTTTLTATISTGNHVRYAWNFGDGALGSGAVVTHTYATFGEYTAIVTATNPAGQATANTSVIITDTTAPTSPTLISPANGTKTKDNTPTFTWNPSLSLDVTGYMLSIPALGEINVGNVTQYTSTVLDDAVYQWGVSAYDAASNTSGYTSYFTLTIDTTPPPPPTLISPANSEVVAETTVTFTWQNSVDPDFWGNYLKYDGTVVDVGSDIEYATILQNGNHTWSMAAYDELGNTSDYTSSWTFETIGGVEGLSATNDCPTLLGETTSMTATLVHGTDVSYQWGFGDGSLKAGALVTHTYATAGAYTAVVTATNIVNAQSDSTQVTVYEVDRVDPTAGPYATSDADLTFQFPLTMTQPLTLTYTPLHAPSYSTGDLVVAGMTFHLEMLDENGAPIVELTNPISLTVHYDEARLPFGTDENELEIKRYDEVLEEWIPLFVISRDIEANTITVKLDHLSEFALLVPVERLYLPLVIR